MIRRLLAALAITVAYLQFITIPIGEPAFSLVVTAVTLAAAAAFRVLRRLGLRPALGRWKPALALLALTCATTALTALDRGRISPMPNDLPIVALESTMEEFLFRGLLLALLLPLGMIRAIVVSSIAFGLAHLANVGFPIGAVLLQVVTAMLIGVVYAAVRLLAGSIWPAVATHIATNVVGLAAGFSLLRSASSAVVTAQLLLYALAAAAALLLLRRVAERPNAAIETTP